MRRRLEAVYDNRNRLGDFKAERREWFTMAQGGSNEETQRPYRFSAPEPPLSRLEFDQEEVLDRFAGHGAYAELQSKGSIRVTRFYDWLLDSDAVRTAIFDEFDMYFYHQSLGSPEQLGWLLNKFSAWSSRWHTRSQRTMQSPWPRGATTDMAVCHPLLR
jgi:hypothetical protein